MKKLLIVLGVLSLLPSAGQARGYFVSRSTGKVMSARGRTPGATFAGSRTSTVSRFGGASSLK